VVADEWDVYVANEVMEWINGLDATTHARVVQANKILTVPGRSSLRLASVDPFSIRGERASCL